MPRSTRSLTQKLIDATPPPVSGATVLRDHEQRGLMLRLWPAGTRSWSFEYRSPVTGKNARLTLPFGTLAEARIIAKSHRATIALGRDPAIEAKMDLDARREAHARSVSVEHALDLYRQAMLATATTKLESKRRRLRVLERAIEPFAGRAVASIGRGEWIKRLDQIQVGSGAVSRNRAQSELRVFLGWCKDRDSVETIALDRVRMVSETPRARVLSDDELKRLMERTRDSTPFSDIVKVLLRSAMRRGEAAALQPRDLDFGAMTITVREDVAKTSRARTIPMGAELVEMLRGRSRGLASDGYVFGDGSGFERPFVGFSKLFAKMWATMPAGVEKFTLHDLRRTVATRLHEAGVDALVIEDLLGHRGVRKGVAGVYNRSVTLERQRHALSAWSATLGQLLETSIGDAAGLSPALPSPPVNATQLGVGR